MEAGFSYHLLAVPHGMEILVPCSGIKPVPPTLEAWSLNHWTTRDQLIQLITVGRSQCSFPYNQCLPPSCEPRREGPLGEIHGGGCPSEALGFLCEHPRAACSSSPAIAMRPQGVCTLGSNTSSVLGKCSVSHLSPPQPWLSSPGITLTWLLVGTVCWACA